MTFLKIRIKMIDTYIFKKYDEIFINDLLFS